MFVVLITYLKPVSEIEARLADHVRFLDEQYAAGLFLASGAADIERGRLVVYSLRGKPVFEMAHAKNVAHRCGMLEGGDILVNLDADNYTGPGFAEYVERQFAEANSRRMFLWSRMIRDGANRRGISGRIAVTRQAFLTVGGYDEKFNTWGPDDKDFNARLQAAAYEPQEIDPKFLFAVLHNNKMRFREYPHARKIEYKESSEPAAEPIANFGNFGCATVWRNFGEARIELGKLPTRIFGIGMHKTATTSLHTALEMLGFDSAHWKTAHWAKAIWKEMQIGPQSQTVNRHHALSDLPVPLLYEELDRGYPGSKFILTTRDEDKWIESGRKHWNPEFNRFRRAWDSDPFTHQVHRLVYGQKGFNEELFRARYRRHNAEVLAYFADRPGDLLVMPMDEGAGWNELCLFLYCPIPQEPYPAKFVTKAQVWSDYQI